MEFISHNLHNWLSIRINKALNFTKGYVYIFLGKNAGTPITTPTNLSIYTLMSLRWVVYFALFYNYLFMRLLLFIQWKCLSVCVDKEPLPYCCCTSFPYLSSSYLWTSLQLQCHHHVMVSPFIWFTGEQTLSVVVWWCDGSVLYANVLSYYIPIIIIIIIIASKKKVWIDY